MLFQGLGFSLIYILTALIVALTIHEASHAWMATQLGDDTPKKMGRLSLNPLAHLDPIGSLMILFVGIGWGRPVPIDANKLHPNPKVGMALVAIAGPISNLILAILFSLVLRARFLSFSPQKVFSLGGENLFLAPACFVETFVALNLGLAIFNLIPLSPLDGSRIWQILLPDRWYWVFARYEIFGAFIVIGLVLADIYLGLGILSRILNPALLALWRPLVGFGSPFSCIAGG